MFMYYLATTVLLCARLALALALDIEYNDEDNVIRYEVRVRDSLVREHGAIADEINAHVDRQLARLGIDVDSAEALALSGELVRAHESFYVLERLEFAMRNECSQSALWAAHQFGARAGGGRLDLEHGLCRVVLVLDEQASPAYEADGTATW